MIRCLSPLSSACGNSLLVAASEKKYTLGPHTPIIPPSYIGMRGTGQEVILRLTTVPAGYSGGHAFRHLSHVINQLWDKSIMS